MDIGELIYNRRKELNLTLEEVGNYVGVSKSTVKKWESGFISNMRRDKIALLAKILKIEPTELIGDGKTGNTPEEETLLSNYRQLNSEGQKKVNDYTEDLVKGGLYSNDDDDDEGEEHLIAARTFGKNKDNAIRTIRLKKCKGAGSISDQPDYKEKL